MDRYSRLMIFIGGWIASSGMTMFYQDLIGKEKYLQMVDVGWVEMSPFWGLALLALGVWVYVKQECKDD